MADTFLSETNRAEDILLGALGFVVYQLVFVVFNR